MVSILVKKTIWLILPALLLIQSCSVYNFSGTSIPPGMKTVSVQFFENNAPLVVPILSQQFTDALKERIRNQTPLSLVNNTTGEANFEGRITDYSLKPTAIQGNERASLNKLTITVQVKYTNSLKPEQGFEQAFTRSIDYSIQTRTFQSQEPELIRTVNAQLTEDIFNKAFANW